MGTKPLIVAALPFEVGGLKGVAPCSMVVTGPGPERARQGLTRALVQVTPSWIVAMGFCGGLHEAFKPLSWAIPEVVASALDRGQAAPPIACAPWPLLPAAGRLVTVGQLQPTARAKAELGAVTDAYWVDMESYPWAVIAQAAGIPFTVVRIVLDGVSESVPTRDNWRSWPSVAHWPVRAVRARRHLAKMGRRILCVR